MFEQIFESAAPRYFLPSERSGVPSPLIYSAYLQTPPRIYGESLVPGVNPAVRGVFVKKERTPYSDFTIQLMVIVDSIYYPGYGFVVFRFDGITGAYLSRTDALVPPSLYNYQIFQARDGGMWQNSVLGNFFEIDPLTFLPLSGTTELPAKYGASQVDLPMVDRAQNLVVMKTSNEAFNQIGVYNFTTGALIRRIRVAGAPVQILPEDDRRCYVLCTNRMLNLVNYATGAVLVTLRAPVVSTIMAWDRYLRRLLFFTVRADASDGACRSTISGYYPVPQCVGVTAPIPIRAPRVNRLTPFLCRTYGDAGEALPGVKITPTLGTSTLSGVPPFTDSDGEAIITVTPTSTGTDTLVITADV